MITYFIIQVLLKTIVNLVSMATSLVSWNAVSLILCSKTRYLPSSMVHSFIWFFINQLDKTSPTIYRQFTRFLAASLHPCLRSTLFRSWCTWSIHLALPSALLLRSWRFPLLFSCTLRSLPVVFSFMLSRLPLHLPPLHCLLLASFPRWWRLLPLPVGETSAMPTTGGYRRGDLRLLSSSGWLECWGRSNDSGRGLTSGSLASRRPNPSRRK